MKARSIRFAAIFCFVILSAMAFAVDSESDRRNDVLRFGLEDEILVLIAQLQKEKERGYDGQLTELFSKTKSSAVREGILAFYSESKNDSLKPYALEVLAEPFDYKTGTVLAVMQYVGALRCIEASPLIRNILSGEGTDLRDRSIVTLGKIGNPEDADFLVEYLEGDIAGDEKQRLIVRQNIMTALGEMKAVASWDRFVVIVRDDGENAMIRASAATAIGKMENPEAVPVLSELFEENDPVLRTAAINGLSNFDTPESVSVILESFKDSYYKVRIEAIAAAEKLKIDSAVSYLLYRARTDPVETVKFRAIEALASFDGAEGNAWLATLVNDEKASEKVRIKAASVLMANNFGFIFPDVEKIMLATLKDDKKKSFRYELGKIVATIADDRSASVATAYLGHKDALTKSIGLDMFEKNRYAEARGMVEGMAADEKLGALQRRAKKILDEEPKPGPVSILSRSGSGSIS